MWVHLSVTNKWNQTSKQLFFVVEFSDNAAKNAGSRPVFFSENLSRKDLMRQINRRYTKIDISFLTFRTINKEKNTIYDDLTKYWKDSFRFHHIKFYVLGLDIEDPPNILFLENALKKKLMHIFSVAVV